MQPLELSFGQPIANTRILTLTAVGINLCGLSGNEPSGDNTKGKCNKSLAEIGKILDKRGRPREKASERERQRYSGKELVNWSLAKYLDRLSSCDSVVCGPFCFGTCIIFC